jgi:hypothetical protein
MLSLEGLSPSALLSFTCGAPQLRFSRGADPGRLQLAPAGALLSRRDKTLLPAAWLQLCAAVPRSEAGPERRLQSA